MNNSDDEQRNRRNNRSWITLAEIHEKPLQERKLLVPAYFRSIYDQSGMKVKYTTKEEEEEEEEEEESCSIFGQFPLSYTPESC